MDNLEEMDTFLETHNLPRLNQEEIENINKLITSHEVESVILKKLSTNRSPGPDGLTVEFYQTLKEFIPGMQEWLNICKSINVIHHINIDTMKDKNHMIKTPRKKHRQYVLWYQSQ